MKCTRCKTADADSGKYCKRCGAEYMKEYRSRKVQPESEFKDVEPQFKYEPKAHVKRHRIYDANIYMSYYVTKGTELHKHMLEAEKLMQTSR